MKKLLFLVIIIGGLIYLFRGASSTNLNNTTDPDVQFAPEPAVSAFSDIEGEAEVLEKRASGDINNDGKLDTVVLIAESGGGSGVFVYAAAYVSGPVSYKGTNTIFLGDRISPQSVSISSGVATVRYLDRQEDEPFAAEPTISVSKQFVYRNGKFVER
jgi:hypothetical protein